MTPLTSLPAVTDRLTSIWKELLGVESVAASDDFFRLGGHSVAAARMMARVRSTLHIDLPVATVFRRPTLGELAAQVAAAEPRPAIATSAGTVPAMSSIQRLQWFAERSASGYSPYTIPIVVRLCGSVDMVALTRAVRDLAVRHLVLRTRFPDRDGEPYPEVAPEGDGPAVGLVRVRRDQLDSWLTSVAQRPFDLAAEVPLRATIARLGSTEHVLAMVVHHIAADGWSRGLILTDLAALYAFHRGIGPAPTPARQYADMAVDPVAETATAADLDWWAAYLAGAPDRTTFGAGRPRAASLSDAGANVPLPIGPELSEAVRAAARAAGTTCYAIFMSALALLLGWHANESDVVVATSLAGRDDVESESVVGCFIRTIPIRIDLAGNPSAGELIDRVALATVTAMEHGRVTFDAIVRRVDPPRDPAYRPLCQVMLTMHNEPLPRPDFAGLTARWLDVDTAGAKVDVFVDLDDDGTAFHGDLTFRTQLYDEDFARHLANRYAAVVAALAGDPRQPIDVLMDTLVGGIR